MYHIKSIIPLEHFRMVTHSYAASFSIKRVLIKLTTFFDPKTKAIYLNLVIVYGSKLKIKVTLPCTFL